jgi:hypothetical protein
LCLHVITIPSTIFSPYDNGVVMVELFVLVVVATAMGGKIFFFEQNEEIGTLGE